MTAGLYIYRFIACLHVYSCLHVYMSTCLLMSICLHVSTYLLMHTCLHVSICRHVHAAGPSDDAALFARTASNSSPRAGPMAPTRHRETVHGMDQGRRPPLQGRRAAQTARPAHGPSRARSRQPYRFLFPFRSGKEHEPRNPGTSDAQLAALLGKIVPL